MRKLLLFLSPPLLGLALVLTALGKEAPPVPDAAELEPASHYGKVARRIAMNMPISHLSRSEFDDDISKNSLDNYLRSLDYDRTLFFWDDVKQFRRQRLELDDKLKDGSTDFAFEAFDQYREHLADRVAFVNNLLDDGFDLEVDEHYSWKRKKAPWPKTEEDRDELWRLKIKNEYVAAKVSRALEAEETAKKKEEKEKKGEDEKTEEEGKDEKPEAAEVPPSIEETIRKRYRSILTNVNQHDAEYVLQLYLNAFTRSYDAHSSYLSPRSLEDFNINIGLSLTGIGAQLTVEDGAARISSIIKGGPAAKDGRLKAGDKIIGVGQGEEEIVDIMFWPLYKSVRLIRGPKGETVVLKVIPADDAGKISLIDIKRDEVKLEERAAKAKVNEVRDEKKKRTYKLGYLDLPDFYEDMRRRVPGAPPARSSARDVRRLVEKLKNEDKVDGLLFDLRDNGGGSLRACVEMTGLFINRGPVVQVQDHSGERSLDDPDPRLIFDKPIVVIVNRQSASASEILAAALQDYGRAIIVGDSKTHGKGSVQSLFPLDRTDKKLGQFKVTTAAFFRIDGKSTQLKGVTPDILLPSPMDNMDVGEEFLDNVLDWSTVDPARFMAVGNLANITPKLKEKSEARRKENADYQAYDEMMKSHLAMQNREDLALHFKQRLDQVRTDRVLGKVQRKFGRQDIWDEDAKKEEGAADLVLDESFHILRDLIRAIEEERLLIEGGA